VAKVWDTMMSALVGSNPQAFLDLVLPGSSFVKHHRNKLGISERQPDAIIQARHPIDKEFLIDREWLERRFSHMHEILRESPAYQWILDEGIEEGIQRGIQQGVQRGREEGREEGMQQGVLAMQQAAINMVIARFAELESLARARITILGDLERLQHLIIDLSIVHSPEEMKWVLLAIDADA